MPRRRWARRAPPARQRLQAHACDDHGRRSRRTRYTHLSREAARSNGPALTHLRLVPGSRRRRAAWHRFTPDRTAFPSAANSPRPPTACDLSSGRRRQRSAPVRKLALGLALAAAFAALVAVAATRG